jgi:uncharacterized membrane protein
VPEAVGAAAGYSLVYGTEIVFLIAALLAMLPLASVRRADTASPVPTTLN